MINLLLASVFLPLSHFSLSSSPVRAALVRRMGERYFTVAYSVVALIAFAWLITAYQHAPAFMLWNAPAWIKAVLWPVILAAILRSQGLQPKIRSS